MNICERRVFVDLTSAEEFTRAGERKLREGNRTSARRAYGYAHKNLRRAISDVRSCTSNGRVADPRNTLARLVEVADKFEKFEHELEGD